MMDRYECTLCSEGVVKNGRTPAAPFTAGAVLLVGGAIGAIGAEWLFDKATGQ